MSVATDCRRDLLVKFIEDTGKLSRSDCETCTEFLVETNSLRLEHAGLRYDILVGSMLVSRLMILLETQSSGNFRDECVRFSTVESSTD